MEQLLLSLAKLRQKNSFLPRVNHLKHCNLQDASRFVAVPSLGGKEESPGNKERHTS